MNNVICLLKTYQSQHSNLKNKFICLIDIEFHKDTKVILKQVRAKLEDVDIIVERYIKLHEYYNYNIHNNIIYDKLQNEYIKILQIQTDIASILKFNIDIQLYNSKFIDTIISVIDILNMLVNIHDDRMQYMLNRLRDIHSLHKTIQNENEDNNNEDMLLSNDVFLTMPSTHIFDGSGKLRFPT